MTGRCSFGVPRLNFPKEASKFSQRRSKSFCTVDLAAASEQLTYREDKAVLAEVLRDIDTLIITGDQTRCESTD